MAAATAGQPAGHGEPQHVVHCRRRTERRVHRKVRDEGLCGKPATAVCRIARTSSTEWQRHRCRERSRAGHITSRRGLTPGWVLHAVPLPPAVECCHCKGLLSLEAATPRVVQGRLKKRLRLRDRCRVSRAVPLLQLLGIVVVVEGLQSRGCGVNIFSRRGLTLEWVLRAGWCPFFFSC